MHPQVARRNVFNILHVMKVRYKVPSKDAHDGNAYQALTNLRATCIEENASMSKGISSNLKSAHSSDSGPGEKVGCFNFARKMI